VSAPNRAECDTESATNLTADASERCGGGRCSRHGDRFSGVV